MCNRPLFPKGLLSITDLITDYTDLITDYTDFTVGISLMGDAVFYYQSFLNHDLFFPRFLMHQNAVCFTLLILDRQNQSPLIFFNHAIVRYR
jgi:hypothetical protein